MPISPKVPVLRVLPSSVYSDPSASQLSSISQRLYFSQNSLTAFISNGLPRECASITAFVFGLNAFSSIFTSIFPVSKLTSTNTGTAPYCKIGVIVVGKPQATLITSSPRLIWRSFKSGLVSVIKASRFALEPEFTRLT